DLAHDAEELERIDRAHDQVVVRVLAPVEVEAAEQALGEQHRDDLLDVRPLRMVAGVDEHLSTRPEPAAEHRRRAPVGQVGAVEAGLEELVLDEDAHSVWKLGIELPEAGGEPRVSAAEVVLPRVVRAVGEPETEGRGADAAGDLDALAAVVERPGAHLVVGGAETPEPELVGAAR